MDLVEQTVAAKAAATGDEESRKQLDDCELDELDELEDLEDDRVLESYRRQRLAEMKHQLTFEKFGSVAHISKPEYQREVTEASHNAFVVVHLYQEYLDECRILNSILNTLAARHKATKFCKIVANLCIPDYPDRNVPTLLVYYKGDVKKQLVGTQMLGNPSLDGIEGILDRLGVFGSNQFDADRNQQ